MNIPQETLFIAVPGCVRVCVRMADSLFQSMLTSWISGVLIFYTHSPPIFDWSDFVFSHAIFITWRVCVRPHFTSLFSVQFASFAVCAVHLPARNRLSEVIALCYISCVKYKLYLCVDWKWYKFVRAILEI